MTLAIAHQEKTGRAVLDCVRERKPPFNPDDVVSEFAATLKTYRVGTVTGDRYAGEWPPERFQAHGIGYTSAERTRSEYYLELLPLLNSGRVELLDHLRLINELCNLERRTSRGGRESIDHPPNAHDDVINAAAGALVAAAKPAPKYEFSSVSCGGVSRHTAGQAQPWKEPEKDYSVADREQGIDDFGVGGRFRSGRGLW